MGQNDDDIETALDDSAFRTLPDPTYLFAGERGWEPITAEQYALLERENLEAGCAKHCIKAVYDEPDTMPSIIPAAAPRLDLRQQREEAKFLKDLLAWFPSSEEKDRCLDILNDAIDGKAVDGIDRVRTFVLRSDNTAILNEQGKLSSTEAHAVAAFVAAPDADSVWERYDKRIKRTVEDKAAAAAATAAIRQEAFEEFFDLARKLNETAHAVGIRSATLDADSGEISVVYRSREPTVP